MVCWIDGAFPVLEVVADRKFLRIIWAKYEKFGAEIPHTTQLRALRAMIIYLHTRIGYLTRDGMYVSLTLSFQRVESCSGPSVPRDVLTVVLTSKDLGPFSQSQVS